MYRKKKLIPQTENWIQANDLLKFVQLQSEMIVRIYSQFYLTLTELTEFYLVYLIEECFLTPMIRNLFKGQAYLDRVAYVIVYLDVQW